MLCPDHLPAQLSLGSLPTSATACNSSIDLILGQGAVRNLAWLGLASGLAD